MRLLVGSNHDEISRFGNIKRAFGFSAETWGAEQPQRRYYWDFADAGTASDTYSGIEGQGGVGLK